MTRHLSYLSLHNIPLYSGVDCLHMNVARRARQKMSPSMIHDAREQELKQKKENEDARKARRQKEDEDEAAGVESKQIVQTHESDNEEENISADSSTSSMLQPSSSPFLFAPFITRRDYHTARNAAEAKLHGNERKKFKERLNKDQENFKSDMMNDAASTSSASSSTAASSSKPPNVSVVRAAHRAQQTSAALTTLNTAPRTHFHFFPLHIVKSMPHQIYFLLHPSLLHRA